MLQTYGGRYVSGFVCGIIFMESNGSVKDFPQESLLQPPLFWTFSLVVNGFLKLWENVKVTTINNGVKNVMRSVRFE